MQTLGLDVQDTSRDIRREGLKQQLQNQLYGEIKSSVIYFLKVKEKVRNGIGDEESLENEEQSCTLSLFNAYQKYVKGFKDNGLSGWLNRNEAIRSGIRDFTDNSTDFVDDKMKVMLESLERRILNTPEQREF